MPDIPIHNETTYSLNDTIYEQIRRDALEYFGESVRSIRVQYGIERHAFNAKTGEMRFAFSPSDFGVIDTSMTPEDMYYRPFSEIPTIDDDTQETVIPQGFDEEDVEADEEEEEEGVVKHLSPLDEEEDEVDEEEIEDEDEDEEDEEEEEDEELGFHIPEDNYDEDEEGGLLFDDEDYN